MKRFLSALLLLAALGVPASAQQSGDIVEDLDFAGGALRIVQDEYDKVVTFDGREIARDLFATFDGVHDIRGTEVALFQLGSGGNACTFYALMVWEGEAGIETADNGGDCQSAAAAVSYGEIVFVPWVGPGEEQAVRRWTPEGGFQMAGMLRFAPEPGTGWSDLAANPVGHPVEYFLNEAFFDYAQSTLGEDLNGYARGLGTSTTPERNAAGYYATVGCVPHNCGGEDSLLVVDVEGRQAWFAQMRGEDTVHWPPLAEWPAAAKGELSRIQRF